MSLAWSFPIDIWSMGCILVELDTGASLFRSQNNLEHLAMIETVLGQPADRSMVRAVYRSARASKHSKGGHKVLTSCSPCGPALFKNSRLDYPNRNSTVLAEKRVQSTQPLRVSSSFAM
jgi:dual-specificity kinase